MNAHLPARPGWACADCGTDWPCAPARDQLARAHLADPGGALTLCGYLARQLLDALADPAVAAQPAGLVHARFLGWVRPVRRAPPATRPRRPAGPAPDEGTAMEKYRINLDAARWRRSTRSGPYSDNCVEVAFLAAGHVGVRDSKQPARPALVFTPAEWDAFLAGAKDGEFDPA